MLLVNGAGVCINEIIWQIIWWHYRDARKMWLLYYFVSLHWLAGICSSVVSVFICVRLRASSIHRIWLRFPWLCAIFPTYTSFLGSRFCVWHSGAKQPFSFSLSKVPGLSFTLNQTLCLCLAWFTHSLLRSPQKRKKKTLESHQGAMKIDATKKEASWKLCLTTELLLFFNYTELWWAGSSKNSLLNLKRGNTKIQDSAENGFWDRVRGVFLSFMSRLLFRIVPRQPKNKAA